MSRRRAFALAAFAVTAAIAANAAARSPEADMAAASSGRIAFSDRIIGNVDAYRIVVVNAQGDQERVLPLAPGHSFSPAWSPDATIYVMRADGTGQRRLTRNGLSEYNPDWSPTGTTIAYDRSRERADVVADSWVLVMNADASS